MPHLTRPDQHPRRPVSSPTSSAQRHPGQHPRCPPPAATALVDIYRRPTVCLSIVRIASHCIVSYRLASCCLACLSVHRPHSSPRLLLAAAATEQLLDLAWYVRDATDCVSVVTDASRRGDFPLPTASPLQNPTGLRCTPVTCRARVGGDDACSSSSKAVWRALLGTA